MDHTDIDIDKLDSVANRLRSIAHPMRIAIIELLKDETLNVTAIYKKLNIEQASASHHLNILKTKGVLSSRRAGKNTYYSLKHVALSKIIECIEKCDDF